MSCNQTICRHFKTHLKILSTKNIILIRSQGNELIYQKTQINAELEEMDLFLRYKKTNI